MRPEGEPDPSQAPPSRVLSPSRHDPVVRAASEVVGGPAGARIRAGRHGWWNAVRVLLALAMALLALGVVQKQHCREQGWVSPAQFFHACYSDLPAQYVSSGVAEGAVPVSSQPVGTALVMRAMAALVPPGDVGASARWFFDLGVLVVGVALVATVAMVAAAAGRRRWDAAHVALSPLVALSALVSLDLAGVALGAAGIWAWARRRPALAGLLLGLGVAVRPYPVLVLLAIVVLSIRAGTMREAATTTGTALAAWASINLPFILRDPQGWLSHWGPAVGGGAGYGSVWRLPELAGAALPVGAVTGLSLLATLAVLTAVAAFALSTRRRPRLPQVALLLTAGVLLAGPSFPVQASLWLLPLAALAVPRWRDHLWWGAAETLYFVLVWLHIAGLDVQNRSAPDWLYGLALMLRLAAVCWLMWVVVRDVRSPGGDPVRRDEADDPEVDDPAGGVLDHHDDALVIRFAG